MHNDVASKVDANRARQNQNITTAKTNIVTLHISVGDFVLVRMAQEKNHKDVLPLAGFTPNCQRLGVRCIEPDRHEDSTSHCA